MTAKSLKTLLGQLPESQRASAQLKIELAEKHGWTNFEVWCESPFMPHAKDLVANSPQKGFYFVPEPQDW